jgi:hypothetical protein
VYFNRKKLVSIKEKSKHTSEERFESKEIHTKKICIEDASENLMQQIPERK